MFVHAVLEMSWIAFLYSSTRLKWTDLILFEFKSEDFGLTQGLWPNICPVSMWHPNCCDLCHDFVEKVDLQGGYLREKQLCESLSTMDSTGETKETIIWITCAWRSASLAKKMQTWISHYLLAEDYFCAFSKTSCLVSIKQLT